MSRGRQAALDLLAEHGLDEEDTCPNGDELCEGEDDLRAGTLPCFECYLEADDDVFQQFRDAREGSE